MISISASNRYYYRWESSVISHSWPSVLLMVDYKDSYWYQDLFDWLIFSTTIRTSKQQECIPVFVKNVFTHAFALNFWEILIILGFLSGKVDYIPFICCKISDFDKFSRTWHLKGKVRISWCAVAPFRKLPNCSCINRSSSISLYRLDYARWWMKFWTLHSNG